MLKTALLILYNTYENNELHGHKKGEKRLLTTLFPNDGWKDLLLSTDFMYDLTRLANMRGKMMELDPQLPASSLAS
ncbi:hypothetical protein DDR33_10010 [Pararcticibacter amylolyticus]|uniref:Uncharacterized protein n=1 Tax=Pararcticibacter amylolyticus TaxID=2173175 RepID=A0A2U2PHA7_9SPHI|nr:hypothetical protein DDR33_10010 [Pararcticibacter amylolyticus]